ncbi:hypothetical protein VUR80DRAFT_7987 [Thermomyces stellatus]
MSPFLCAIKDVSDAFKRHSGSSLNLYISTRGRNHQDGTCYLFLGEKWPRDFLKPTADQALSLAVQTTEPTSPQSPSFSAIIPCGMIILKILPPVPIAAGPVHERHVHPFATNDLSHDALDFLAHGDPLWSLPVVRLEVDPDSRAPVVLLLELPPTQSFCPHGDPRPTDLVQPVHEVVGPPFAGPL